MKNSDLDNLIRTVEILRRVYKDMTLRQVQVLLLITKAGDAGLTGTQCIERCERMGIDMNKATISRYMQHFSKAGIKNAGKRADVAGLDLCDFAIDPYDHKSKIMRVNANGRELLNNIFGDK